MYKVNVYFTPVDPSITGITKVANIISRCCRTDGVRKDTQRSFTRTPAKDRTILGIPLRPLPKAGKKDSG